MNMIPPSLHETGLRAALKPVWLLVLAVGLQLTASCNAQIIGFDFDESSQFTDNFRVSTGALSWVSKRVRNISNPSKGAVAIYDTNPQGSTYSNATFLTETVTASFSTNYIDGSNTRMGIVTRVQENSTGILARFDPKSATTGVIRLLYGYDTVSGAVGLEFYNSGTVTMSGTLAINDIVLTLHQGFDASHPTFQLEITSNNALMWDTGLVALLESSAFDGPGAIGFFNQNTTGRVTDTLSFHVIPEPGMGLLGSSGALLLLTHWCRRKSQSVTCRRSPSGWAVARS